MKIVQKRALALLLVATTCGCGSSAPVGPTDPPGNYSTNFPSSENPISQAGKWVNGGRAGLDWANVSTSSGLAIGHQGTVSFSDATAVLQNMTWGNDQSVQATVYNAVPQPQNCAEEVELRLRTHISAHSITGYEITWSTGESYFIVVRWNGPFGDFTYLIPPLDGEQYNVQTGDVIKATMVGNTISAYKNGVLVATVTDSTFPSGAPGMGFNLEGGRAGCLGLNGNYGFTNFQATSP